MAVDDRFRNIDELAPVVLRVGRSISNARSWSMPWRAIRIPFACSITARRPNAPCRL